MITLNEFFKKNISEQQAITYPLLQRSLIQCAEAVVDIAQQVRTAPLYGLHGDDIAVNSDGDTQQKLDLCCDTVVFDHCSGVIAACVSEESRTLRTCNPHQSNLLLCYDPLDGSSNIDVNISIGSVFSWLPVPGAYAGHNTIPVAAFLQPGRNQIAAAFAVYGPATEFVLTLGNGAHIFYFSHDHNAFILGHTNITVPAITNEFAINIANRRFWDAAIYQYIDECLQGDLGPRGRHFNTRWVASMVADVNRFLIRGGSYMYPADARVGYENGRIRYLYEVAPISMIVEQAGGKASTGHQPTLDVIPNDIHSRCPALMGSHEEIQYIEQLYRAHQSPVDEQ